MCGIVGYLGQKDVVPILLNGLKRLEYRGYDSAGLAVLNQGRIVIEKSQGKIVNLEKKIENNCPQGVVGIGHTRWATHGCPSDANAHPHFDCKNRFAVVHNGIIENYLQLKEELIKKGHKFNSETDTEVIPHLLEQYDRGDLVLTVREVLKRLEGSYGLVVISKDQPEIMVAARKDSPLVVGLGEGENFVASDLPAILEYTRKTIVLGDQEIAVIYRDRVEVTDFSGQEVHKKPFEIQWNPVQAEKNGYEHFMLKEINEQPKALRDTLHPRLNGESTLFNLEGIKISNEQIKNLKRIIFVACGTSYHAGLVGKSIMEKFLRIPVEVDLASEFRYRDPIIDKNDLVIAISQSGETADTLAAMREAKSKGVRILAITNVVGSSISRDADDLFYTWAGPEIAVASTKAYLTQLLALYIITVQFAQIREQISAKQAEEIIWELRRLPELAQKIIEQEDKIKRLAEYCFQANSVFFIGRRLDYAVALEGALKLKEVSYIHAEAYAAGELKHGTLALIEDDLPIIALVTQDYVKDKTLNNIRELKARGAKVVGIAIEGDDDVGKTVDQVVYLPKISSYLTPILAVIPLQFIAYYVAVCRGCDVDKPRNLAKSVTVE